MAQQTNKERLEAQSGDYTAMKDKWQQAADLVEGEKTVVKATTTYLPKFPKEHKDKYDYRLSLAKFTNVYRDTLENLANKPFDQEVKLAQGTDAAPMVHPPEIETFIEDVDGSGSNITVFASECFFRGINYAVDFILVDYPYVEQADGAVRSRADEEFLGLRPYWSFVSALNLYEAKSELIKGKERFTYARIFEPANGDTPDRFRELFYDKIAATARFVLWRKTDDGKDYQEEARGPITIGYIPLVPFWTGRRKAKTWQFMPPMQDSADLQVKLYRAESNLEYTKTVTAFPMLQAKGMKPDKGADDKGPVKDLPTGPDVILYAPFSPTSGSAGEYGYLEPSANSLKFLADDILTTKQDLRELGRQPLTVSSGNLTVITTAVAAGKAKTAVKKWGVNLADTLSIALYYTALWLGISYDDPKVIVYDGYDDLPDTDNGASIITGLADKGKLSDKTMCEELQRRGILSSEFDYEQEMDRISQQPPPRAPEPTGFGGGF